MKRILLPLLAVLFLTCCGTPLQTRKPVRGFLYRGEHPQAGLGAYGYLVFTAKPDAGRQTRYQRTCDSFMRSFPSIDEYRGKDPASLMITYWLLDQRIPEDSECARLVEDFDYATSNEIASEIKKLSSPGPILVAWQTPFDSGAAKSDALVLDLSDFSEDDLDRAIGIWKERVVKDPSVWNKGFNLVKTKEAFRNLLQRYGDQILSIIKPGK